MALEVTLSGQRQLRELAKRIQDQGDKGLGREMAAALRKVSKPVQASVEAEYETGLPKRGGYVNTFTKSIKWRTALRGGARSASFRLTIFGDGAHEKRDIKALEAGRLRHPVFGRSRRIKVGNRKGTIITNPWALTTVRGGYFERGTDSAADKVEAEMSKVLDEFTNRLK